MGRAGPAHQLLAGQPRWGPEQATHDAGTLGPVPAWSPRVRQAEGSRMQPQEKVYSGDRVCPRDSTWSRVYEAPWGEGEILGHSLGVCGHREGAGKRSGREGPLPPFPVLEQGQLLLWGPHP